MDQLRRPSFRTASMDRSRGVFSSMHLPKWVMKAHLGIEVE